MPEIMAARILVPACNADPGESRKRDVHVGVQCKVSTTKGGCL